MLRLAAEHADIWNMPGPPHSTVEFAAERSALLDQYCAAVGRDPATVIRSVQVILQADDAAGGRDTVSRLIGAGFSHIVLAVRAPAPDNIARWLADEIITPVRERLPA
jgi:alkanesulfonate monooxygenase SsuD/methylene tetrahydromethanopterin reductase-like flavin-dependent oxidoreductase (luciferase family)